MADVARPESALRTRRAVGADVPRLAALAARSFEHAFGPENDPADLEAYVAEAFSEERIEAELAAPESVFLLGFDESRDAEEPVGYCRLVRGARGTAIAGGDQVQPEGGYGGKAIAGADPVELERLYVDGAVRGAGYGSALMWDALELARESGCRTIWLGVWERNSGARRFYERWGFEVVGEHEFVLGSDRQRDVLMARAI